MCVPYSLLKLGSGFAKIAQEPSPSPIDIVKLVSSPRVINLSEITDNESRYDGAEGKGIGMGGGMEGSVGERLWRLKLQPGSLVDAKDVRNEWYQVCNVCVCVV